MNFETPKRPDQSIKSIRNVNNQYGYQINVSHPLITPKWERFKNKWKAGEIESDKPYSLVERRLTFEKLVMDSKFYIQRMAKELQMFGLSFKAMTGLDPEEIKCNR